MTDVELIAWAAGYLAGWDRADELAELDGWRDLPPAELNPAAIERGMWRNAWRALVLAGVDPTEELIKEQMWKLQT